MLELDRKTQGGLGTNAKQTPKNMRLNPTDLRNLELLKELIAVRKGKNKVSNTEAMRLALSVAAAASNKVIDKHCSIV